MKKFLSLVLALVMTMSLVTVSAGAVDFTDDSDIDYKEAVDVISALGIVDGYSDDSFRPDGSLTRGAAAKIICNLILGPTTASALSATTAPFKDVPTTNTFAGYITYCAQQGIIGGYGDGTFRPTGTLTGNAFMKMLLGALGYDSTIEGYTGANWQVNVIKQASGIGLDDGNDSFVGSQAVTRQEAALYAFNMLQATMVEYDTKTTVNVNGATVTIAGDKAQDKSWGTGTNNDGNIEPDGFVQFAEQYFGDLKLYDDTDDFGRPSNMWRLKGVKIGTYPREADVSYTASVEAGDIYRDLGLNHTVVAGDVTVFNNGVDDEDWSLAIKRSSDEKVANSGNGTLTEVFYDSDADKVIITTVETYVGTINKSVDAKGDDPAYVEIAVESAPAGVSGILKFETEEEFEDDAYVLYTYSESAEEVKSAALAEEVSGTVTRSENSKDDEDFRKALTIDGNRYTDSVNIAGEDIGQVTVKNDYTVYLDSYGYMIYIEEVENTNYALLLSAADKSDYVGKKAELVFADGTSDIVTTDKYYGGDELGTGYNVPASYATGRAVIVTYKVDSDGVYELRAVTNKDADGDAIKGTKSVTNATEFTLTNDSAGIVLNENATGKPDQVITANSASTFVIGEQKDNLAEIEEWTSYTGIKNVPSVKTSTGGDEKADIYYYCKSSMVTVMFVLPQTGVDIDDDTKNTVFLAGESVSNLIHDEDGDYYEYKAVINGEVTTAKVDWNVELNGNDLSSTKAGALNGLFKSYSVDKDGVITRLTTYGAEDENYSKNAKEGYVGSNNDFDSDGKPTSSVIGIDRPSKEYTVILGIGVQDWTITVDEDAAIYYVDEDGEITVSSYKALAEDTNDAIYAHVSDYMVDTLFVQEVPTAKVAYGVKVNDYDDTMGTVLVDGKKVDNSTVEYERNEDAVITVIPEDDYQVKSVTVDGTDVTKALDKDGQYTIERIRSEVPVVVVFEKIPAETMDVYVTYVDSTGSPISGVSRYLVEGVVAEDGKSYVQLGSSENVDKVMAGISSDYEFVSADPVKFEANGYTTANVVVEKVAFAVKPVAYDPTSTPGFNAGTATVTPNTSVRDTQKVTIDYTGMTGWNDSYTALVTADADYADVAIVSCTPKADGSGFIMVLTVTNPTDDFTITLKY